MSTVWDCGDRSWHDINMPVALCSTRRLHPQLPMRARLFLQPPWTPAGAAFRCGRAGRRVPPPSPCPFVCCPEALAARERGELPGRSGQGTKHGLAFVKWGRGAVGEGTWCLLWVGSVLGECSFGAGHLSLLFTGPEDTVAWAASRCGSGRGQRSPEEAFPPCLARPLLTFLQGSFAWPLKSNPIMAWP